MQRGLHRRLRVVRFQGCHLRTFWNSLGCTTGQNNSSPGPLCKQRRLNLPLNSCSQHCQWTFSILKTARAHYCTAGVVCEPQREVTQLSTPQTFSHIHKNKHQAKPMKETKPRPVMEKLLCFILLCMVFKKPKSGSKNLFQLHLESAEFAWAQRSIKRSSEAIVWDVARLTLKQT